ncbi:hypothetical protein [Plantactinospora sp. GCM10030261]|uniref:hypothetical protein n=1 Tax=Plantactinospora sp. GCM10030261 TaxID=3273420 RepID=UPI0036173E15
MNMIDVDELEKWRGEPLVAFVGVDTFGSASHAIFDGWARILDRSWILRGIDLPLDTSASTYRRLVGAMRANQAIAGAVVTGHKLRLYAACADELVSDDPLVGLSQETNTLAASAGEVRGYARDPVSLTHVLPAAPRVISLGAGGAGTALLLAQGSRDQGTALFPGGPRPVGTEHMIFVDRDRRALEALRTVATRAGIDQTRLSFVPVADATDCDAILADVAGPALVVNATGLGKDSPGSPVTDRAPFTAETVAWDLNYRGDLTFLRQAARRGARTVDGWDYFVAGWAGALSAIAGVPFTADLLARFRHTAAPFRPTAPFRPAAPFRAEEAP